jgi:hypothetical protein
VLVDSLVAVLFTLHVQRLEVRSARRFESRRLLRGKVCLVIGEEYLYNGLLQEAAGEAQAADHVGPAS